MRYLKSKNQEEGAALAVGLILLLIITLMGYTGMKGTMLQEKMAAGLHNRALANNGANSALRGGEKFLYNLIEETNGVGLRGSANGNSHGIYTRFDSIYNPASGLNTNFTSFVQDGIGGIDFNTGTNLTSTSSLNSNLAQQPQYFIQELLTLGGASTSAEFGNIGQTNSPTNQFTYLVTGWSTSGDGNTISVVQSLYTAAISSSTQ